MCPLCIANAATTAAGAVSTGAAVTLTLKVLGIQSKTRFKENDHDKNSTGKSPSSVAN
jgi:hypothetical protein